MADPWRHLPLLDIDVQGFPTQARSGDTSIDDLGTLSSPGARSGHAAQHGRG